MNDIEKEKLQKMRKRIDMVNKIRLAFIFIAVVLLVFIYFGNKIYTGVQWYDTFVAKAFVFLSYDILFMLIAIFVKIGLTVRYNSYVKKSRD